MEIEISDVWKIISQRFVLISIIVSIIVVGTGIISFYIISPKYEASTTVIMKKNRIPMMSLPMTIL